MALIVVLWLVVLLSIMAAGHSKNVHTDTTLAARQVQSAKARALAEAGINHVILEMLAADSDRKLPVDGSLFTVRIGDDDITIAIRDATGFVDLNAAKPELLEAALEACGVGETARRDLVDAVLEAPVAPSFTRVGHTVRSRLDAWQPLTSYHLGGRVVVLTGPTSGLGLAAARTLADLGATLVLVGRDHDRVAQYVEQLVAGRFVLKM